MALAVYRIGPGTVLSVSGSVLRVATFWTVTRKYGIANRQMLRQGYQFYSVGAPYCHRADWIVDDFRAAGWRDIVVLPNHVVAVRK
jgi:hypothetical protein